MYLDHHAYPFDAVFGERDDSATLYRRAVRPLVDAAVQSGGVSSVIMFGQTARGRSVAGRDRFSMCGRVYHRLSVGLMIHTSTADHV